jgi:hypothetical protein
MKGIHPKRPSSSFLMDTRPSYNQVRYSLIQYCYDSKSHMDLLRCVSWFIMSEVIMQT